MAGLVDGAGQADRVRLDGGRRLRSDESLLKGGQRARRWLVSVLLGGSGRSGCSDDPTAVVCEAEVDESFQVHGCASLRPCDPVSGDPSVTEAHHDKNPRISTTLHRTSPT